MIGIAITAILCTILGFGICAMLVVAKDADKRMVMDADCTPKKCKTTCKAWVLCDNKWTVFDEN